MATTNYTIDSALNINGVTTSGTFTASNIPIILNGSRCTRLRKGSPSSYSEMIHKKTTYSRNINCVVNISGGFTSISHSTSCGSYDNTVNWYLLIMTSFNTSSGDGSYNSMTWTIDQDIVAKYYDADNGYKELGRIPAGTYSGSKSISGTTWTCPGWPSRLPEFYVYSVNDNSPFKINYNVTFNGTNYTLSSGWFNLGTHDNSGKLIAEASSYSSTSATGQVYYNSSYGYTVTKTVQEY